MGWFNHQHSSSFGVFSRRKRFRFSIAGQIRIELPKGSAEGFTKVPLELPKRSVEGFAEGATKVAPRSFKFRAVYVSIWGRFTLGCQRFCGRFPQGQPLLLGLFFGLISVCMTGCFASEFWWCHMFSLNVTTRHLDSEYPLSGCHAVQWLYILLMEKILHHLGMPQKILIMGKNKPTFGAS